MSLDVEGDAAAEALGPGPSFLKKQVAQFTTALVPLVLALLIQVASFAVTARGLGAEAFGSYSALLALSIVSIEIAGLGGADLLVRAVSRDPGAFRRSFGTMLSLLLLTFPIVLFADVLFAQSFLRPSLDTWHLLALIAGEVLIGRVAASVELIFVAHRRPEFASAIRFATATLRCLAAVMFFLVAEGHDLNVWVEIVLLQSVVAATAYLLLVIRLFGVPLFRQSGSGWSDGLSFSVVQTARALQGNIDRLLLGHFAEATVMGVYGASSRILAIGLFALQVITRMTYPNFFVHGEKGLPHSRRYALKILPLMLATAVASAAAVAVAGYYAPLFLGRSFAGMSWLSGMISLALPLIALQYPAADALTGAGKQKLRATISVISAIGFGVLMTCGVLLHGVTGMLAAFLAGHALVAAGLWSAVFLARD